MNRQTIIRTAVFTALNGYEYKGVAIPVFDEVVNPKTPVPSAGGAEEVYIVLQDQQEYPNAVQPFCDPRFDLNLTIRVVTKWGVSGSKIVCEEIASEIISMIRDDLGNSKINVPGLHTIEMQVSRTQQEITNTSLAFSSINILNFIKNG